MEAKKEKSVGIVCSTYRDPSKDTMVRLYGVVSLFDQMSRQTHEGTRKIVLVDDSPTPHPFYKAIEEKFSDSVIYLHAPSRDAAASQSSFIPSNDTLARAYQQDILDRIEAGGKVTTAEVKLANKDFALSPLEWDQVIGRKIPEYVSQEDAAVLQCAFARDNSEDTQFWKERIQQMRGFARFIPFESDYPIQTNIFAQMFQERPTIGMKKNAGVDALTKKFGDFDAIVFADDDDHHAPDYVRQSVEGLGNNDFTRMTHYLTYVFNRKAEKPLWGEYNLPMQQDANGYWTMPPGTSAETIIAATPEGTSIEREMGDGFSRLITMAWPIISHEGALHTYSHQAWKNSVEAFGGIPPVSFSEDIIYFRMLKDHLGVKMKSAVTPVDEPSFIRVADGNNASMVYWMKNLEASDTPAWAQEALKPLEAALKVQNTPHETIMHYLGKAYVETGKLDLSLIRDFTTGQPEKHHKFG